MKKSLIAASLLAICSVSAQADVIGVTAGAQVWSNQFDGKYGKSVDQTTFNLNDKTQGSYYISLEHPLPFIPNLKISKTTLDTDGVTDITSTFAFGDQTFETNTAVDSVFNLSYIDYTLYYELFDNDIVSFDFGLTARDVSTDITASATINGAATSATQSASGFIPMLYVATEIGIPATDFFIFANGNFLSFDNNTLYDYQAGVRYEFIDNLAVDLSATLGYRAMSLQLENLDNLYTDINFKGVFAGLEVHF
jgi:outer membrane protein